MSNTKLNFCLTPKRSAPKQMKLCEDIDYVVALQSLGGRDVQEDHAFAMRDSSGDDKDAVFIFDGFGGQAISIYLQKNLTSILKRYDLNLHKSIDFLDLELRVNALFHENYLELLLKPSSSRVEDIDYYQLASKMKFMSEIHQGEISIEGLNLLKQLELNEQEKQRLRENKEQDPVEQLKILYQEYYNPKLEKEIPDQKTDTDSRKDFLQDQKAQLSEIGSAQKGQDQSNQSNLIPLSGKRDPLEEQKRGLKLQKFQKMMEWIVLANVYKGNKMGRKNQTRIQPKSSQKEMPPVEPKKEYVVNNLVGEQQIKIKPSRVKLDPLDNPRELKQLKGDQDVQYQEQELVILDKKEELVGLMKKEEQALNDSSNAGEDQESAAQQELKREVSLEICETDSDIAFNAIKNAKNLMIGKLDQLLNSVLEQKTQLSKTQPIKNLPTHKLLEFYRSLIYAKDDQIRLYYSKSKDKNLLDARIKYLENFLKEDLYKNEDAKAFRANWINLKETLQSQCTEAEAEKLKQIPQYQNYDLVKRKMLAPFYCLDQRPIEQSIKADLRYGWVLLQAILTYRYLIDGVPDSNPLRQSLSEEEKSQWAEAMHQQGLEFSEDEEENSDLIEDLYGYMHFATSLLQHHVLARFADHYDLHTKFGERKKVGSTVVGFLLDHKAKKISFSWRGDSVALLQRNKKGIEPQLISTEHKPNVMSIGVGRFIGAIEHEEFYALNKCQVTESSEIREADEGDQIILMTDGAYEAYKKYRESNREDAFFPSSNKFEDLKNYFMKILTKIHCGHEKGDDNCTMISIKIPFNVLPIEKKHTSSCCNIV